MIEAGKLTGTMAGERFRDRLKTGKILPLMGAYDVFSAKLVSTKFEGVFCSGFGLAASYYGLPDVGFVTWRDMLEFSTRVRHAIPNTHILVDVDDGFGDEVVASNIIDNLESNGLSSIMIEDQKRPRKCGHYDGKVLLPIDEYLIKLKNILKKRKSIFVIARTDAETEEEGLFRAIKYAEAGADGVMIEGIRDLATVKKLREKVNCPIMINQLHGGKSPNWTLEEMEDAGVSIVIYSTPCLFSSQFAIQRYLDDFLELGKLQSTNTVDMNECSDILYNNFKG